MAKRRTGSSREAAAAAADMSVRSARRIERNQSQPRAGQPRGRTRPDPLGGAWEDGLVPLLQPTPALTPITLLEHLQRRQPDGDWLPHHRTLQCRVRQWKALHGPAPEVIFPLSYEPGEIAFWEFTHRKGVEGRIAGLVFPHLLVHYGQEVLRPLPPFRFADDDIEPLKARRTGNIEVCGVVDSVPSRLIGQRVTVPIFHGRLQVPKAEEA